MKSSKRKSRINQHGKKFSCKMLSYGANIHGSTVSVVGYMPYSHERWWTRKDTHWGNSYHTIFDKPCYFTISPWIRISSHSIPDMGSNTLLWLVYNIRPRKVMARLAQTAAWFFFSPSWASKSSWEKFLGASFPIYNASQSPNIGRI